MLRLAAHFHYRGSGGPARLHVEGEDKKRAAQRLHTCLASRPPPFTSIPVAPSTSLSFLRVVQ